MICGLKLVCRAQDFFFSSSELSISSSTSPAAAPPINAQRYLYQILHIQCEYIPSHRLAKILLSYGPHLWGFQQGEVQTSMLSYRD